MELTREEYTVSKKTLEMVLKALGDNWFDGEYNNDDIIAADKALQKELEPQNNTCKHCGHKIIFMDRYWVCSFRWCDGRGDYANQSPLS